jgi:Cdc6-like AAA superfamily ATPase
MIIKSNINNDYIGPKALFDPNYIPPNLLYRKKEVNSLLSILNDSISDEFCLNVLYHGTYGIGKKVIINKVINDLLIENKDSCKINKVCVDCKEKEIEELIFSLLNKLASFSNLHFDYRTILNSKVAYLWNTFKFICNKINSHLFLIFNNIEYLEPEIFNKFLQFSKETNITLISTVNKFIKPRTLDLLAEFDFKHKLDFYSYNELYSILKQRVLLSFSHEIDNNLIRYITDLICEQYVPVPGKGIEILRDIYPIIKKNNCAYNFDLLEICQNEFDSFQISDEFGIIHYLSEEDILTIVFLDNLSNYFLSKMNYYISFNELIECYNLSCESLECTKNNDEFYSLINELLNLGIIKTSKRTSSKKLRSNGFNEINCEYFFPIIHPKQIKVLIDTIFNQ